jgi:hypothetical protein
VDLERLANKMAATIEKAKADDPRELRKQIAELKKQLAQGAAQANTKNEPVRQAKTVEKFVLKDGQLAKAAKLIQRAEAVIAGYLDRVEKVFESAKDAIDPIVEALGHTATGIEAAIEKTRAPQQNTHATMTPRVGRQVPVSPHVRRAVPAATASRPAHVVSHDGGPLPPGELATLTAALQYPGLDRKRLGILTGYKRSSRDAYIARLASKGLVELAGGSLHPTEAGAAALNGSFEPLPTGAALIDYWRAEDRHRESSAALQRAPERRRVHRHCGALHGFNVGNAMKYLWRAGLKGDRLEDLRKAAWYVNREIERLMRNVLDHGYVEPIEAWGSDERIIEAARMSTAKGFQGWGTADAPGDEKLLRYLWRRTVTRRRSRWPASFWKCRRRSSCSASGTGTGRRATTN